MLEVGYALVWRGHSVPFYLSNGLERKRALRVCNAQASVAIVYSTDCRNALYAQTASGDPHLQNFLEREARVFWSRR